MARGAIFGQVTSTSIEDLFDPRPDEEVDEEWERKRELQKYKKLAASRMEEEDYD